MTTIEELKARIAKYQKMMNEARERKDLSAYWYSLGRADILKEWLADKTILEDEVQSGLTTIGLLHNDLKQVETERDAYRLAADGLREECDQLRALLKKVLKPHDLALMNAELKDLDARARRIYDQINKEVGAA